MGDIGALALGAALGMIAVIVRQELVVLIMGGIFVVETASVIIQVASFKLTGKRIFRMAPIHHHYELKGWAEPKVIVRFWIISLHPRARGPRHPETAMTAQRTPSRTRTPSSSGMGRTGLSVARHLQRSGCAHRGHRHARAPPELAGVQALGAAVVTRTGGFDARAARAAPTSS